MLLVSILVDQIVIIVMQLSNVKHVLMEQHVILAIQVNISILQKQNAILVLVDISFLVLIVNYAIIV